MYCRCGDELCDPAHRSQLENPPRADRRSVRTVPELRVRGCAGQLDGGPGRQTQPRRRQSRKLLGLATVVLQNAHQIAA